MIKMYQAQGEFEGSLNSIGKWQNELIRQHLLTQEWYLFNKGEISSTSKPESSIPKFTPSQAKYKFEPMNLKPQNPKERRNELYLALFRNPIIVILFSIKKKKKKQFLNFVCKFSYSSYFPLILHI